MPQTLNYNPKDTPRRVVTGISPQSQVFYILTENDKLSTEDYQTPSLRGGAPTATLPPRGTAGAARDAPRLPGPPASSAQASRYQSHPARPAAGGTTCPSPNLSRSPSPTSPGRSLPEAAPGATAAGAEATVRPQTPGPPRPPAALRPERGPEPARPDLGQFRRRRHRISVSVAERRRPPPPPWRKLRTLAPGDAPPGRQRLRKRSTAPLHALLR